jgi:hypothetical protein
MLTITEPNMAAFNELLTDFYETGEQERIKAFLYEKAIDGIYFEREVER